METPKLWLISIRRWLELMMILCFGATRESCNGYIFLVAICLCLSLTHSFSLSLSICLSLSIFLFFSRDIYNLSIHRSQIYNMHLDFCQWFRHTSNCFGHESLPRAKPIIRFVNGPGSVTGWLHPKNFEGMETPTHGTGTLRWRLMMSWLMVDEQFTNGQG